MSIGTHQTHCCLIHEICKYGDDDCPVLLKQVVQTYPCEYCGDNLQEIKNDPILSEIKKYCNGEGFELKACSDILEIIKKHEAKYGG